MESEEDEETLIERRRQKRLAIVAKYSGVNNSQVGFVDDHVILVVVIVTSKVHSVEAHLLF